MPKPSDMPKTYMTFEYAGKPKQWRRVMPKKPTKHDIEMMNHELVKINENLIATITSLRDTIHQKGNVVSVQTQRFKNERDVSESLLDALNIMDRVRRTHYGQTHSATDTFAKPN